MKKQILYYVFNGFNEWECGEAAAAILTDDGFRLRTISIDKEKITSAGGMKIVPDLDFRVETDLSDIDPMTTAMIILPGGVAWEDKQNRDIMPLISHCASHRIPIAASGAAVIALADLGMLNDLSHTSDHIEYLRAFSPVYDGEKFFRTDLCVGDQHLITCRSDASRVLSEMIIDRLHLGNMGQLSAPMQHSQRPYPAPTAVASIF